MSEERIQYQQRMLERSDKAVELAMAKANQYREECRKLESQIDEMKTRQSDLERELKGERTKILQLERDLAAAKVRAEHKPAASYVLTVSDRDANDNIVSVRAVPMH